MSKQSIHPWEVLVEKGYATRDQSTESNDCTVKALCITKGISYQEALKYATENFARKPHKGARTANIVEAFHHDKSFNQLVEEQIKTYYINQGKNTERQMTLGTFIKRYPSGKFYVIVRGHALAVVDGVIIDYTDGLRRPVWKAWRIIEDQRAQ